MQKFSSLTRSFIFKNTFLFGAVTPKHTQLLLNNKWVDSASKKTFDIENPATQEKICSIS